MIRRVLVAAFVLTPAFAAAAACNAFSLPTLECVAEGMNVAQATTADPCQACLQARCCDAVGDCQRAEGCSRAVQATHACVLDGGRAQASEPLCTPLLRETAAVDAAAATFACLDTTCRAECGLPSCRFGADVPSFLNGACDRCVESTCCDPVAACVGDRHCLAALSCITSRCSTEMGAVLAGAVSDPVARLERAACEGATGGGPSPELACLVACLDLFVPSEGLGLVPEDRAARCEAARVLACGSRSACGPQCSAGGTDAGRDASTN